MSTTTSSSKKIFYLDHIKVILTVLVILHHAVITYGGPGGWYYRQPATDLVTLVPMTLFVSINQSFFMGLFFFLSALFTETSYERKGIALFLRDRLKRLGIPLVFYSFMLSPILTFLVYRYGQHHDVNFWQYLSGFDDWIDFGVLWFVAALLLFTLVFTMYKSFIDRITRAMKLPKPGQIFAWSVMLGLVSFIVRLKFPVGWVLAPPGFQFAHFTQYIFLFCMGIAAYRGRWLEQLDVRYAKIFGRLAALMILVVFPLIFVLQQRFQSPLRNFSGGFTWESLLISIWEQVTGISIIAWLLSFGRLRWNKSTGLFSALSRCSFGVYIFHPLFLIGFALLVSELTIGPVTKLLIVAPTAVICSFLFASLLVRIPYVNRVL